MSETWLKEFCPKCSKVNWVCQGDLQDCTIPDVEGIQCWSCNKKFWLDEDFAHDYHFWALEQGVELEEILEINAFIKKGQEMPTI